MHAMDFGNKKIILRLVSFCLRKQSEIKLVQKGKKENNDKHGTLQHNGVTVFF